MTGASWSTQQLVEFVDAVSTAGDAAAATDRAVDRAAEALDAEIAGIVSAGGILASVGYPRGRVPARVQTAVMAGAEALEIEGLGRARLATAPVGDDAESRLFVARLGEEPFERGDLSLLRGMGRALELTLRRLRGIEEERALRERAANATQERVEAERQYRLLLERVPAIVYKAEVGEHGRFLYASPKIEGILGFSQDEWLDDPEIWASRLHPDDRERVIADELESVDRGDLKPIDYRMLAKDGRVVWFIDEAVLELDRDGTPYWHGVLYDITDRKLAEEQSVRMKNEFFALVSHELRTPLTSIIGYLELITDRQQNGMSEQGHRALEVIGRNAKRLYRLVGDLLFAAQLESGTFEIEPGPARLDEIAADCVEAALPGAGARGVELALEVSKPLPACTGDGNRLGQAIDNLLSNAIKFTGPGGSVRVGVAVEDEIVSIEVSDSGVGIPAAEQDQLFDRFFRSSQAIRDSAEGAGLGLAIVKAIVEGHDGAIAVQSEVGVGTRVRIEFPFHAWDRAHRLYAGAVSPSPD